MSVEGNTAIIADEHPWVSPISDPARSERRRGLLAPVAPFADRRTRPRLYGAAIGVVALALIVVAQLGLSILVTNGAYQITSLQQKQVQLGRSDQAATEDVGRLSSPQNLAANADALGMVSNGTPVYLRLSDGKVIGSPTAAAADAGTPSGSKGSMLVPNQLLNGIPLVTSTSGVTPTQAVDDPLLAQQVSDAAKAKSAASHNAKNAKKNGSKTTTKTDAATGVTSSSSQQIRTNAKSTTPADNAKTAPSGPVAWSGQLPSPQTH